MFYPYFDVYYLILVIPALLVSMWAQSRVSSTYSRYGKVRSRCGMSGSQIARQILDDNGLYDVRVEQVSGNLTDHYDPRARVVRLSQGVYGSDSIAALGVAAHETGHADQHATRYAPLTLRNAIVPVTNFGAKISVPLILLGVLFGHPTLTNFGILCFGLMTVFQLITLPVEFNASSRAMATLSGGMILDDEEAAGAKRVLSAAALTSVATLPCSDAGFPVFHRLIADAPSLGRVEVNERFRVNAVAPFVAVGPDFLHRGRDEPLTAAAPLSAA